jgi:tRNA(Arg) A34 adenosine deaminase TadA
VRERLNMLEADRFYLTLAMEEAERAAREGTFPIGAVIAAMKISLRFNLAWLFSPSRKLLSQI